jgi:hypothetical protein
VPASLLAFEERFATEESCRAFLEHLRWPDGFRCPRCDGDRGWRVRRGGLWFCISCKRQTSVTVGTIFERTHTPLRVWFRLIWLVTNQKHGISALGVQRALGLGTYQTAWTCLHKLRRAMVRPGRDRLKGLVEVDEVFVGGFKPGVSGRTHGGKVIVAVAVELEDGGLGRVRMQSIPDASGPTLHRFVQDSVEAGAAVRTDGWSGYFGLQRLGYRHQQVSLRAGSEPAHVVMPAVHRVAALLKRWWLGTHQGAIAAHQLAYYLDEFTFRFNRRRSRQRGLLFLRLLENAVQLDAVPYRMLANRAEGGRGRPTRVN